MNKQINFIRPMASLVMATALLSGQFVAPAMARDDAILTPYKPKIETAITEANTGETTTINTESVEDNKTAEETEAQPSAPVDLTTLIETKVLDEAETAPNIASDNASNDSAVSVLGDNSSTETTSTQGITLTTTPSASISLIQKDPASIRLAAVGIDRPDHDGLDRLMWQGSRAETIIALQQELNDAQFPRAFDDAIHHLITARVIPPEGFVDVAPALIEARFAALAAKGASDDLARMISQLPHEDRWAVWQEWLVLHHLFVRQDQDACRMAAEKVLITLDALWHQINAFCAVVEGDIDKASFALDILMASGISSANYDGLMRQLTGQGGAAQIDPATLTPLDLVLLDSAHLPIDSAGLAVIPASYQGSISQLRYWDDDAQRQMEARRFHQGDDLVAVTASWALLPASGMSSAEALTRFGLDGTDDEISLARLDAWQAIAGEADDRTAALLALEAFAIDYQRSGIRSLDLWMPLMERGANILDLDGKIAPLLGFSATAPTLFMNEQSLAWNRLLVPSGEAIDVETLADAEAFDALPMLMAIKAPLAKIDWVHLDSEASGLANSSFNLPYQTLMQIEAIAEQGRKAETLMRVALMLDGVDLSELSRDDAARVTGILFRAGLKNTARQLAHDILLSWGLSRHLQGDPSLQAAAS